MTNKQAYAGLLERLQKRAEIRRQIPTRKSVKEGAPDRIADLLDEAAEAISSLLKALNDAEFLCARVRELEADLTDDSEAARQFYGHVIPALARMESAMTAALNSDAPLSIGEGL